MKGTVGTMLRKFGMVTCLVVAGMLVWSGCEGGGDGGGSGGGSFVGTWALYSGSVGQGTPWYVHFQSDGTFSISNGKDGSDTRVTGTYTVSDGKLVGPFTNPGVGDGRVEATVSGDTMNLDFIEYWHTPNKVVPYVGART